MEYTPLSDLKKDRADQLLERIKRGPIILGVGDRSTRTAYRAAAVLLSIADYESLVGESIDRFLKAELARVCD